MNQLNLLDKEELKALCKKHRVASLYIFGSATGKDFNKNSDADFLVKFLPIDLYYYFENYLSLKENLEKLTGRTVDLVEEQALKNSVFIDSINRNKELVYG